MDQGAGGEDGEIELSAMFVVSQDDTQCLGRMAITYFMLLFLFL